MQTLAQTSKHTDRQNDVQRPDTLAAGETQ